MVLLTCGGNMRHNVDEGVHQGVGHETRLLLKEEQIKFIIVSLSMSL